MNLNHQSGTQAPQSNESTSSASRSGGGVDTQAAVMEALREGHKTLEGLKQISTTLKGVGTILTKAASLASTIDRGIQGPSPASDGVARAIDHVSGLLSQCQMNGQPAFDGALDMDVKVDLVDLGPRSDGSLAIGSESDVIAGFKPAMIATSDASASRSFHLRVHESPSVAACTLRPSADLPDPGEVTDAGPANCRCFMPPPPGTPMHLCELKSKGVDLFLPPTRLSRETVTTFRRALAPLGLRVTRRGQTLRIQATVAGLAGSFRLRLGKGIERLFVVDDVVPGVDVAVRVDGRPAAVSGRDALVRRGSDQLSIRIAGALAVAGGETMIHASGGLPLPIARQSKRDGSTIWLPKGWPSHPRVGRISRSDAAGISIALPQASIEVLGLSRLPLSSVARSCRAGRVPRRASEAIFAAMRQLFDVTARADEAVNIMETALVAASADWATLSIELSNDAAAACGTAGQSRRSAA